MALINQSGMYNGSAPLNPLPYVNIAIQARQRKQAREDAIDKHFHDLPNTINDKGVRDQEIEGLNTMKNDIYSFGQKNKEALRNPKLDNGAAQFTLQKKFRDASTYAQESKNRTATALKLAQLRGNPKYDYIFRDPKTIDKIAAHEAPVGLQGSQAINFDQLTFPPPPFDPVKHISGLKVKPNPIAPTYQDIPGDKFNRLEITGKQFSPEDLNSIHVYAQTQLENNPSFEKHIKDNIETNPKIAAQMADLFQKNYGHPIESEADVAAAYDLSLRDLTPTQKVVANRQAISDDKEDKWKKHNALTFAQSLAKIKANKQAGLPPENVGYVSDEVADEVGVPQKVRLDGKESDRNVIYVDQVDPERLDIITGRDLSKKKIGVKPVPIKQADGSIKFGYYQDPGTGDWEGDGGQKISREAVKDRYIQSKAGTKFKAETGTKGSENTKQQTKVHTGYSRADLKGAGWSDKQIDEAVKAGKIKID